MENLLILALLATVITVTNCFQVGQTVKTASGDITGQPSSWKPQVSEYLGIPFAEPPVGKLRWAAPVAVKPPGKPINATSYGPSCLAGGPSKPLIPPTLTTTEVEMGTQSEDCLYVNVWSKPQSGEKKKAVMVWFDGRAILTGGGPSRPPNGALLADEHDVVVVNLNSRLGVFGFANLYFMPAINFGLRDQRLAVEWVRDNIEAFGGDSSRITLFGQAAGSTSIAQYTLAWREDPIAHAFIMQSGTTNDNLEFDYLQNWQKGVTALGCDNGPAGPIYGETTVDCMRNVTSKEIGTVFSNLQFGPSTDRTIIFKDSSAVIRAGNFSRKPVLIGHTENEVGSYSARSIYPMPVTVTASDNDTKIDMRYRENFLLCFLGRLAAARAKVNSPTWVYAYAGDFPNQKTSQNMTTGPGHGSEIDLIFGTTPFTRRLPDTPEQASLALKMREAWTSFAKAPETGLEKLNWPKYRPNGSTVVTLGGKDSSEITFTSAARYGPVCNVMTFLEILFGVLG